MRVIASILVLAALGLSACGDTTEEDVDPLSACIEHLKETRPDVATRLGEATAAEPDAEIITVTVELEGDLSGTAACDVTANTGEVVTSRVIPQQ